MDVRSIAAWLALALQGPAPVPSDTLPADLTAAPPFGLPEAFPDPAENAFSEARLELGRRLFFDPALSLDRSVACASCHRPEHGLADPSPMSTGVAGRKTL